MIKMPLSVVRAAAFCLPLSLVASCGSGDSEGIQGTAINFYPENVAEVTLDIETVSSLGQYQIFRIEARSPTGYSQIGVSMLLSSDFTVYEGHPAVVCTVLGPGTSTCTAPGATPLNLTQPVTTAPNGTYEVTVVYSISPFVTGDITLIEAFSGTGYNFAKAIVTCGDSDDTAGTNSCL